MDRADGKIKGMVSGACKCLPCKTLAWCHVGRGGVTNVPKRVVMRCSVVSLRENADPRLLRGDRVGAAELTLQRTLPAHRRRDRRAWSVAGSHRCHGACMRLRSSVARSFVAPARHAPRQLHRPSLAAFVGGLARSNPRGIHAPRGCAPAARAHVLVWHAHRGCAPVRVRLRSRVRPPSPFARDRPRLRIVGRARSRGYRGPPT